MATKVTAKPAPPAAEDEPKSSRQALCDAAGVEGLWDTPTVAAYLGLPVETIHKWAFFGKGPSYRKIGKHRRYDPREVRRWSAEQPKGGQSVP